MYSKIESGTVVNNAVGRGGRDLPEIIIILLNKSGFQHHKSKEKKWVYGRVVGREGGREQVREGGRGDGEGENEREGARERRGRNL